MISRSDAAVDARLVRTRAGWCWIAGEGALLKGSALPYATKKGAMESLRNAFPFHSLDSSCLRELQEALVALFAGEGFRPRVKCDWSRVTSFQAAVYKALRRVRFGQIITYGELALRAGHAGAARGVGSAMARNPFAPFVPCHRVVASGMTLGGFSAAGGLITKRLLLNLEGHKLSETRVVTSAAQRR